MEVPDVNISSVLFKMRVSISFVWLIQVLYSITLAAPTSQNSLPGSALLHTVYEFPNETWVENLAIRSNGNILVTLIQKPEVWELDPHAEPVTPRLLYGFPDAISVLGIVEVEHDVFVMAVGNWSDVTDSPQAGSWSIWSLDLRKQKLQSVAGWSKKKPCVAKKIGNISEAIFLNGLTILAGSSDLVLVADSIAGVVYRFNWRTGDYSVAIDDPALKPNGSTPIKLGVNGIHVNSFDPNGLYATNSLKTPTFFRIPINPHDGSQVGAAKTIVDIPPFPLNEGGAADDFALQDDKFAWITSDTSNTLYRASLNSGSVDVVAGAADSGLLAGVTSCAFGVTEPDKAHGRLYITTNGGIAYPPPMELWVARSFLWIQFISIFDCRWGAKETLNSMK